MKFVLARLFSVIWCASAISCGQSASGGANSGTTAGSAGSVAGGASSAGAGGASAGAPSAGMAGAGSPGAAAGGASAGATGSAGASAGAAGALTTGSGCAAPGTICWDFEGATSLPTGWTAYRNEMMGQLVVDATKPHQGTNSLHAQGLKGGTEGQQGGPKKTIRYNLPAGFGPVLWGRVWVFTDTVPLSHSGLFNARYARPGTTDTDISKLDWYELATYMGDYMSIWHPPEPPGYPEWVKLSATAGVKNAWACLEWQFDGANGTAAQAADPRVWLNGAELTWPMEYVFSDPATTTRPTQEKATNFSLLETGVYLYQGLPNGSETWIDDLAVGKERIGCK